jgi:hypothetical protein
MAKSSMKIKYTLSAGRFDSHGSPPVGYKEHHLMGHAQGYTGSHWMPPLGNYLLHISPAATRATGKQTTINKYTYFAGHFDSHDDAPVRNCAHHPMEEVTRSHWVPPLGKYYVQ